MFFFAAKIITTIVVAKGA